MWRMLSAGLVTVVLSCTITSLLVRLGCSARWWTALVPSPSRAELAYEHSGPLGMLQLMSMSPRRWSWLKV